MAVEYTHYSPNKITEFFETPQDFMTMKPRGIWLCHGTEWKDYFNIMGGNKMYDMNNCYIYKTEIDESRIFIVDSYEKLTKLVRLFGSIRNTFFGTQVVEISWPELAYKYDGIVFKNFHEINAMIFKKGLYFNLGWFTALDMDSVCIWKPESVMKNWRMVAEKV